MNIFLPFDNINKSVEALDDKRLIKQILECYQIYTMSIKSSYSKHPVVEHYKNYPFFVVRYALAACGEYKYRFGKEHEYEKFFIDEFSRHVQNARQDDWDIPFFYAEYSKTNVNCIRTTNNVPELFKVKLTQKWINDMQKPKWTKREQPEFYKVFTEMFRYAGE